MKKNSLKEKINAGNVVLGPFLKITDPAVVEIAGYAGFDFVIIDQEHGPISTEAAQNMIRAAEAVGIAPIIRVQKNEESVLLKALDIGAEGIEVPHISSKTHSDRLRKAVMFAPEGERGVCCYVRSAEYSRINKNNALKAEYFKRTNSKILVIGHIEGVEGIRNIEEILMEEVIDVIFIGPYDLSQSLGVPGQVDNPLVEEKMKEIIDGAKNKKKSIGTFVDNEQDAKKWISLGVQFIAYSVDVGILYDKYREIVTSFLEQ